ncbi:ESPR-type extended signal peptide-containing protein, partial [Veillonella sp.]
MNKIFKVVWSKTKECYVVVSEVAKNNGGKKKVLASVLAGLAMVGAGAAGTPVQAATDYNKKVNISPNGTMAGGYSANNSVSDNSIVVGYGNDTSTGAQGNGHVAYGFGNTSTEDTSTALGGGNKATGPASTAVGSFNEATARAAIAMGNVSKATGERSVAIGSGAEATKSGAIAIGRKSQATEGQAVAIGEDTEASGPSSVAVGYKNQSTKSVAVGFGVNNKVYGEKSTAVGSSNTIATDANEATVIGRTNQVKRAGSFVGGFSNVTNGERNVAVGSENTTTGEESIGIGTKVIAGTGKTIAIGGVYNPGGGVEKQTIARGDDTINPATGQVNNVFALAIGNGAQADGKDNKASGMIAIGQDVLANNTNAMALGIQAKATGRSSMAFGQAANAAGSGAFALGQSANATSHGSIAMGNGAQSTGSGSTALGRTAKALNDGTVALGFSAEATGDGAIAIGGDGKGAAFDSTNTTFAGLGEKTTATAKNAVAVGHQATANIEGGVALGSESKTTKDAGEIGYNPAAGRTNKYDNLTNNTKAALTSTRAAVSIGDDSTSVTRQLTGLAAGTQDTDAVNVAQLKAVNLKFAGDSTQVTGSTDVRLNDGTFNVNGDGTLISTEATATGIKVKAKVGGTINNTDGKAVKPTTNGIATTDNVADAINNSYWKATAGGNTDGTPSVGNVKPGTQVTYSAGDNLKVKQTINATTGDQEYKYSLNPVLTGITSIANTTTGPKMTFGGNSINITGGSLDMGTNKITNLAPGTADNDAVNVKQLKDTELHITPGTYTPDANKKVKLTYTDGNNTVVTGKEAVIDLSGLATGGTTSTEKVQKAADATGDKNIAEVGPKSGDTFGAANATYEVSVSRNAVKDAAREAVTVNNGGTTTGGTYTADTNNPISVTPTPDNTNHNTTYAVTFDGNKAAKQIPLTYKATNGTITTADQTVKLDKGLNFTGGDYTTASVGADGKVTFDVTLGTAPTVTDGKPGVPGQAGAAGKDGIATVKTVVDTINNSGWKANAKANGGTLVGNSTATVVKPGDQVNFAAGKNLTVKQDLTGEHTYTYSLNKDIDLTNAGSLTVGDTKVNNDGITIKAPTTPGTTTTDVKLTNTGLDNGGNKIVNVAEGKADTDAVNVKQLKDAKTKLVAGENTTVEGDGTTATPYKVNVKGDLANISSITNGAGSGKISFGNDQVVTVNGDHPISLNGKTGDITGLTNTTIPTAAGSDFATKGRAATEEQLKVVNDKFNNKINLGADTNETTKFQLDNASGIKFNIKGDGSGTGGVNQYISTTANGSNVNVDLTADAKAKLNKTYTVSSGSTNVTVTPTTTGDNTDFKITVASTGTTTSSSWNLATDKVSATEGTVAAGSAATQNIADTKTVTMQAGKNLTVKQTNDGAGNASVAYSLDKDISVENITVTGQNGKDGSIGINGKDGVTRNITVEVPGQAGQPGTPGVDGTTTTRIVFDGKAQANLDDGLKFTGNNESTENKHKLNTLVKVQGEGTKEGTDAAGAKEIQTSDGTKFESAKDNIAVEANGADTLTVKLNKNLKGLDSVTTKEIKLGDANDNISIKKDGDRITYTTNNGGTTTTNKVANLGDELHITPGTYEIGATNKDAAAKNDEVTLTYTDGNGVEKANTFAKIKGVAKSDLSNISNDGKKVITGLGSVVKAGDNVTVKTDTDATTGQKTYTVNAVTPAVYTKADGTKVIKRPDGTFTTNLDGSAGNDVPASDVIVSFQDAAGNTTGGNSIVNNVGSAIDKTGTSTGDTFLTKLDNAATATPNAAVNVKDLKNTSDAIIGKGLKFDANEGGEKTNKLGSKVTVQGTGTLTAGKAYADEYNTANIRTNIEQGTDGNTTINVGLAKALKDINSISNGGSSITISNVPAGATTPAVTISGGNLSMGDGTTNNKIVNLAPGTDGTDAVNLNQLKGMRTVVTSTDKSVTVTSNENSTTGQVTYDLKVATTGTVSKSTWDLKSGVASATEGTHSGDTTQTIADTKSVTMQAGKNLTVKQTNDGTGNASVAYSLDKDISVETVTVTGQNGKDGSIGINGKDGVTRNITVEVPGQAGQPGTPGVDG